MTSAAFLRPGVADDPGLRRANDEDSVFVDEAAGILLVVDGIGRQAAGETGAETAVPVIAGRLANISGPLKNRVCGAIAAANNADFGCWAEF